MIKVRNRKKYECVAEVYKDRIFNGEFGLGEKLPTVEMLVREFRISKVTADHAMKMLQEEGLVSRNRKGGTVVIAGKKEIRKVAPHTIYVISNSYGDQQENPWTWFITEQITRGIINSNKTEHRIALLNANDLDKDPELEEGLKGFILSDVKPERVKNLIIDCPYVENQRRSQSFKKSNSVNFDAITSAYNGVIYLINNLGHRKIAMLWGGYRSHNDNLAGYRMALNMTGIPFCEESVFICDGGEEAGYKAAETILQSGKKFTAIFSDTDLKAIGAIKCLREHKVRVPEDVSVIGSDDIPGKSEEMGLTTVRRPFLEIGEEMLKLLIQRIENSYADVPSVPMCGRVVQRNTCTQRQ